MKIVVLDGHALNPGDLSWTPISSLGDFTVYEHTSPAELRARAAAAAILLTNKTVFDAAALADLTALRYIGVLATGYNVVDIPAATARGIVVTNVPAYSTASVAQTTFALLLELTHHVGHHAQTVAAGRWSRNRDFCYWDYAGIELEGLTMGLIGLGNIGQAVVRIATAFGMRVLGHSRRGVHVPGVENATIERVFSESDVVSLHCPLTLETKQLVNLCRLATMKPSAFLLNTSRGSLIDEAALADALNTGRLAGAGLDVLSVEPPAPAPPAQGANPLLTAKNCLITPHIAWGSVAARQRLMNMAAANVQAFMNGKPQNRVS